MIKVALVNPNTRNIGRVATTNPPLGLLSLASYLRTHGFTVKFIDADIDGYSRLDVSLKVADCAVVGVTLTTMQAISGYKLITYLKVRYPSKTMVVGGAHPSGMKDRIFRDCPAIDYAVVGEGEVSMLELCRTLEGGGDASNVDGVYGKHGHGSPRGRIHDLDAMAFPAVDLAMPISRYHPVYPPNRGKLSFPIMASRGCPFHCSYCGSAVVWNRQVVNRSPENIVAEILHLRKFGVDEVFFLDDTLNLNHPWLTELCHLLIDNNLNESMWFKGSIRANRRLCNSELFKLMRTAGFWVLAVGVESGCQEILDGWNKQLTVGEVTRCFKLLKKANIQTVASFIIGHPLDTEETVEETIRFARMLNPDYYDFPLATPLPDTEFEREVVERGLIVNSNWADYVMGKPIVHTETLTVDQLNFLRRKAFHDMTPITTRLKHRWRSLFK